MSGTAVTDLLRRLQGELERAKSVSDEDLKLLRQLSLDIHELLDRPRGATDEHRRSMLDRLQEAITRFEVTHPDITGALAAVSQKLADMGI